MSFVLVGKCSIECGSLAARPNVTMAGQIPYKLVPLWGRAFDVAIMPWRTNRWIEACNPIKLKEYLALGKPIVSTPFPELRQYGEFVYQADDAEEFADGIKKALLDDSPQLANARRARVRHETWEDRTCSILRELFPETDERTCPYKEVVA